MVESPTLIRISRMNNANRFIKALKRQPVDRTPVWMMRQAGRYLPEYRKLREKVSGFLEMCQTPELACEVTLQPLRRFPLDAAIVFSDILTIPHAMGMPLHFSEKEGPIFDSPISTTKDINKYHVPEMEKLDYVFKAIQLIKKELNSEKWQQPLIGFCGSPWTVATYMVEGKHSKNFSKIKAWVYNDKATFLPLIEKLTEASINYLLGQIAAGCDAVMIFDTWGGILDKERYLEMSLAPMEKIAAAIKKVAPSIPIILFTKGGGQWLTHIAETGCDAIGLDWMTDIKAARTEVGSKVALQGNVDPSVLYTSPKIIFQEVAKTLAQFGKGTGHVMNLGHGILPDIPVENVQAFIEATISLSPQYHL